MSSKEDRNLIAFGVAMGDQSKAQLLDIIFEKSAHDGVALAALMEECGGYVARMIADHGLNGPSRELTPLRFLSWCTYIGSMAVAEAVAQRAREEEERSKTNE